MSLRRGERGEHGRCQVLDLPFAHRACIQKKTAIVHAADDGRRTGAEPGGQVLGRGRLEGHGDTGDLGDGQGTGAGARWLIAGS